MTWQRNKRKKEAVDHVYTDVVVDLETCGTAQDTQILSIGAVRFHPFTRDDADSISESDRCFYARLDEDQQELDGRSADGDTMRWWASQTKAARGVFKEEREEVTSALHRFVDFCKGAKRIWGNGNMFDNTILRDICSQYGVEYPVRYNKDLDLRTVMWMWRKLIPHKDPFAKPEDNDIDYTHNALDDAKAEALGLQQMIQEFKEAINGFKETKE